MNEQVKQNCTVLQNLQIEHTRILSATYENTGVFDQYTDLPPFYRVVLETSFGEGSLIFSEIWLPEDWNGVLVGRGNGGMAGVVHHNRLAEDVRRGYASATTDMGSSDGLKRGIQNKELWKDYGWRATHVMTVYAKQIISALYGRPAAYSYFIGSSTGGRQALLEAQRFPADYDGIIAGVPSHNMIFSRVYVLWKQIHLRTRDGQKLFREDEIPKITDAAAKYFQGLGDGEPGDNFVTYPYRDANTVNDFIAFLRGECPTFSERQLEALRAVYTGPVNPRTRQQIYCGLPIGAEIYRNGGIEVSAQEKIPNLYAMIWAFGEDFDGYDFDFDKDVETFSDLLSKDFGANDPNLNAFRDLGGKLLMFSGSADAASPFADAVHYYERVMETMNDYDETASFFRYFISPGKDHNVGGRGANLLFGNEQKTDLLDALRAWREKGEVPQYLIAAREEEGKMRFMRKIYPYGSDNNPRKAFSKGTDEEYLRR